MRKFGGVAVDECTVVSGEIFSCCLVFGEVPTGGKFGLQSLVTEQKTHGNILPFARDTLFLLRIHKVSKTSVQTKVRKAHVICYRNNTYPNFSEEITNNVKSRDSSSRSEGRAATAIGQRWSTQACISSHISGFPVSSLQTRVTLILTFRADEGMFDVLSYRCGWEG